MSYWIALLSLVFACATGRAAGPGEQAPAAGKAPVPNRLRLYVLDCGVLYPTVEGVERYHIKMAEVDEPRMPVPCFLVAHPKGTLMWDVGVIPDAIVESQPQGAKSNVNPTVSAVVTRTLKSQLMQIGYVPGDISYVAISHAHIDHTANLNAFRSATWLTPKAERDFMWTENNPRVNASFYTELKNARSVMLDKDEHDVFGDGRVVIKSAPGHTPGHQVLVLNLASTGRVMLSGDLYHYPQERTLRRPPPDNEYDVKASAASRVAIEQYLQKTGTVLWIEHDFVANAKLKKSPGYYD